MRNHRISRTQLALITTAGFSIMSLFTFPGDLLAIAGRSSLFAVLIMWGLTIISAGAILGLGIRFPGQTVVEYSQSALGKVPGLLLLTALASFHLLIAALIVEDYSRVIYTMFLPRTPELAVLIAVLFAAGYVANLGLQAIGRTCELLIPIVYVLFGVLLIIGISRMEPLQLRPSLVEGWPAIGRGIYAVYYPFLAPQIIYLLTAFLDVSPRRAIPWAALGVGLNIGLVTAIFILIVGILGISTPWQIRFPGIFAIQLLFVPGFFVENVGYVVAVSWTILMTLYLAIQLWGQAIIASRLIPALERHHSLLIIVYSTIILLIRFIFAPERNLNILFNNYVSPLGLVAALGFPFLLLLVSVIRGIRGPERERPGVGRPRTPRAVKVRR